MAKTGSVTITQNSQSIANNTSSITVVGYVTTSGESWRGNERTGTYTIKQRGSVIKSGSFTHGAPANSKTQMFSVSLTINHDSNGDSGTIEASFNYDSGWCTGSASKTLTKIYRQSTFGTISGSTLGSSITVNITRYNSAYTHTLWYSFGSKTWQSVGTGIGTSKAFTPALSLASEIPNAASGKMTLILRTFNGSTQIGSDVKKEITVSVPNTSDTKPILSFTVSDANGYAKSSTTYLKGMSAIKAAITSSGQYGASIKTIATTVNGSTYYTNPAVSSIINKTGSISVSVKVTDSRGYSTTSSQSVSFINYTAPIIDSLKTVRCDSSGNANSSGAYIKASFTASANNITGNTVSYLMKYKKVSGSTYTTVSNSTKYDGTFSVSNGYWIFPADSVPYTVMLTVTDAYKSTSKTVGGSAVYKLFSICKAGVGLAFGKVAEFENWFECAFTARFNENVFFGNKSKYKDGQSGAYIDKQGFMHIQRNDGDPYLAFSSNENTDYGAQIAYGKDTLDLAFKSASMYKFDNSLSLPNEKSVYAKDTNGNNQSVLRVNNYNNLTVGYDLYNNAVGNTYVYGNDVQLYSANAGKAGVRPYMRAGDAWSITVRTAGFVTSGGTMICFTIPMTVPIVGNPTITITSDNGLLLRQNNGYTHGSTVDGYVKPTKWAASYNWRYGIYAEATMGQTTGATNNSPIGITFSGRITLS